MSWHLSSVLFFLLLMVTTCGPACADNSMKNSVDIFVPGQTKVPDKVGDLNPVKDVKFFLSPVLVGADDVMTVLASTDYTDKGTKNTGIVARYIGTHGMKWAKKVTESNGSNWKTQLVIQKEEQGWTHKYQLINLMAAAKGNKIYLLVLNERTQNESQSWINADWDFELTVGEVKPVGNAQLGEKTIEWQKPKSLNSTLPKEFKDQSMKVFLSESSVFLGIDERIVFVMRALRGTTETLLLAYMNDTGKGIEFEWSSFGFVRDCFLPSIFGWERKLIGFTHCWSGSYGVMESVNMGKTWRDATGPISRLWSNWKGKPHLTTATIENKPVLFLSEIRNLGTSTEPKHGIHLGVTDGNRLYVVEPFVVNGGYVSATGLLHTNGELFSLYKQSYINGPKNVFLMHFKDELEIMKSVLKIWAWNDEYLSRSCEETALPGASSETFCITPVPTEGLIGFLFDMGNNTCWFDEYLYVDATVRGGTKLKSGFRFDRANSGVQWPIGKYGLDKQYDFEMYGLTVVATVTIHNTPESDTPLLTLGEVGDSNSVGLWYDKNMQWKAMSRDGGKCVGHWKTNQTYRVALILVNNNLFAYVDGKFLWILLHVTGIEKNALNIQNLFIGGYDSDNAKGAVSQVTVDNVFLYNRPLSDIELQVFNEKTFVTPGPTNTDVETVKPTNPREESTRPTRPYWKRLKPKYSGEGPPRPIRMGDEDIRPIRFRNEDTKLTNTGEETLTPTNPGKKSMKTKDTEDSSAHVSVGATILFLLALWDLVVL